MEKARRMAMGMRDSQPPSRLPVMLSLICPGLGQFAQQRWMAGAIHLVIFLGSFLWLVGVGIRQFMTYLGALNAISKQADFTPPDVPYAVILIPLAISLLVFLYSVIDAWAAYQKTCRQWYERKIERQLLNMTPLILVMTLLAFATQASASPYELNQAIISNNIAAVDRILESAPRGTAAQPFRDGISPLHVASALDRHAIAAMLIAYGADIHATNSAGFRPLHWAASRNATNSAVLLINLGADINCVTPEGLTPLHWAAAKNMTNMVRVLLVNHANLDAVTRDGLRPLDWAVQNNAEASAELIALTMACREPSAETPDEPIPFPSPNPPPNSPSAPSGPATPDDSPKPSPNTPRVAPGATLLVPLGHHEALEFVWIKSLKIWFGKYEVTNGQYRRFKSAHDSMFRDSLSLNADKQPVVYVSWEESVAFCKWLTHSFSESIPAGAEFRLPRHKEWMTVASCGDDRVYPWGNALPPKYGNLSDRTAKKAFPDWRGIDGYDDGFAVTCLVTESGANEWGVYGLVGNVWEWCEESADTDGKYKIRHGGSWDFDTEPALRIDHRGRDQPKARCDTIGIRLIVAPPP